MQKNSPLLRRGGVKSFASVAAARGGAGRGGTRVPELGIYPPGASRPRETAESSSATWPDDGGAASTPGGQIEIARGYLPAGISGGAAGQPAGARARAGAAAGGANRRRRRIGDAGRRRNIFRVTIGHARADLERIGHASARPSVPQRLKEICP